MAKKKTKKKVTKKVAKKKVVRKPRTFAYGIFNYGGKHYVRSYLPSVHGKKAEGYAKKIMKECEEDEKSTTLHLVVTIKKLNQEEFSYWEDRRAEEMGRVKAGERPIL